MTAPCTIVIPTFNERETLPGLCAAVREHVVGNPQLLVVDDQSPDGTADVARALGCDVIVRTGQRGLALSVVEGIARAKGQIAVVIDADGSHPAAVIPELVDAVQGGMDLAVGSRHVPGGRIDADWPLRRRLLSGMAQLAAKPLTQLSDPMSGFFAVRVSALDLERLRPRGYKILLEIDARHDLSVAEVPIEFRDRTGGDSKLNVRVQLDYLRQLGSLYRGLLL